MDSFVLPAGYQVVDVRKAVGFGEAVAGQKNAVLPDTADGDHILHLAGTVYRSFSCLDMVLMVLIMLGLLPFVKMLRLFGLPFDGTPGLQPFNGIFQRRVVVIAVLKLKLLRLQHFRAQPRPDELFRRHAMVGDKAQHGKGGRPQNAHPGQGFHPKIGAQDKIKAHGHAAGENRK